MVEKLCPVLMVMGTASSVGKSLMVTGLLRAYRNRGLKVAPFKAQNMALNSNVTDDGKEIGRAQAVQAEAAGVASTALMNPVLLKPEGDRTSQVVVMGKVVGAMSAKEYHEAKPELRHKIVECLNELRRHHDLVIIEGAGSPAEINLKSQDIVNMFVARSVQAPVLLVGDIDRGGVFASFVGTMALLTAEERDLIKGFVINKFRGDISLLIPGYEDLLERTGVPVLGTMPYLKDLRIAEEDSIALESRPQGWYGASGDECLDIAIIRLPRISNYDEFDSLEHEPDTWVRYVYHARELKGAHLVIIPGSKKTISDLRWMRERGFDLALNKRALSGEAILGICGGCQILGHRILDPDGVEGEPDHEMGLGLIPLETRFESVKVTARVHCTIDPGSLLDPGELRCVDGYEIHMGRTYPADRPGKFGAAQIIQRNGESCAVIDGASSENGMVLGTLVHGLLDDGFVRLNLLNKLRQKAGIEEKNVSSDPIQSRDEAYEQLGSAIQSSLDMAQLDQMIGLDPQQSLIQ